jgi:hypothetical protein
MTATIWLTPGEHVIDGELVAVPPDGDKDLVEYPIAAGRHIVDSKIVIVPNPATAVRIQIKK